MGHLEIVKFAIARDTEENGYEPKAEPTCFLEQILTQSGEEDTDTIIEIRSDRVFPRFKWSTEKKSWEVLN